MEEINCKNEKFEEKNIELEKLEEMANQNQEEYIRKKENLGNINKLLS